MARLLVLLVLLFGGRALADVKLEPAAHHGRVTVLAEPGLADVAEPLAASADATLAEIAADLVDLPVPQSIEVHLVRDASDLAAVTPGGAPDWAVGIARPDLGIISVAMRRHGNPEDPQLTLRHELGHIALGAALGKRAPHWLHEGFAFQHAPEWSWNRTETLAGMAWFGGIIPLRELDASFPAEESPANRAYAESFEFVAFLADRGRYDDGTDAHDRWPFRRFLTELGHGKTLDEAAIRAYGRPLDALFDEWRESISNHYVFAPIGLIGLAAWILVSLLLYLAYRRRRRQSRSRLAQWDLEDARRTHVVPPPHVPWPGEDPLADDDEPEDPPPPRWIN
ncbi:MAG TPA: hypothetical protein VGM88_05840 [Kofleriaceae bacterium]|jgi:hypothetical protein